MEPNDATNIVTFALPKKSNLHLKPFSKANFLMRSPFPLHAFK